jgi:BspA type Leucine rich repeat region (6 copies)/PKD domain
MAPTVMKQNNPAWQTRKHGLRLKALKAALLTLGLWTNPASQAQDYSAPFYYTINAGHSTVTITGYNGTGGSLTIPYEIAGLMVSSIGEAALAGNTNITSVFIPDDVSASIGVDAFADSPSLANVTIGNSVNSMALGAFAWCGSLTNVIIGDSVTNIGDDAFSKCTNLAAIMIPDSVTSIGNSAFWESGLASITIPDSVTNIANYAFLSSANLTNVTIGSGVSSIGTQVFSYCPNLGAINVDAQNPAYMSAGGVLFTKNQSVLLQYPPANAATSYTIPDAVGVLSDWAFLACTNLESVTIGAGVTNIGYVAFCYCAGLTNIFIPDSVTSIGSEAFSNCGGLTNAVISGQAGTVSYAAFAECSNLATVTIDSGITNIGELAFYETGLTSVTIPEGVTSIGEDAFFGTALANLIIPNSVASIGEAAFAGCANLVTLTIGEGLTNIGDGAFSGCEDLRYATLGDNVTSIGNDAFYGTGLTTVTIPATVTSIGPEAFESCGNLRTVYFRGDAPAVGSEAFAGDDATVYYLAGTTGWSNFSTNTGVPAVALNGITFTANPTNGVAPLTVNFTSPGVDSAGNSISNWNWSFGDGATSTAQNPSHVYAAGTFYPALFATNGMGVAVLGSSSVSVNVSPAPDIGGVSLCGANLVLNVSNGLAGATYHLIMSADLTLPLSQWAPVATNNLSASGSFTFTLTNAFNTSIRQQFYILQWP